MIPDGLDFLESVALSKERGHEYNLSVLRQFSEALHPGNARRKGFTRTHKAALRATSEALNPLTLMPVKTNLTARLWADILRLAQSSDSPPPDVVALLVSYGLDYLAREMRTSKAAPPAHAPTVKELPRDRTSAQEIAGIQPTEQVIIYERTKQQDAPKRRFSAPREDDD